MERAGTTVTVRLDSQADTVRMKSTHVNRILVNMMGTVVIETEHGVQSLCHQGLQSVTVSMATQVGV